MWVQVHMCVYIHSTSFMGKTNGHADYKMMHRRKTSFKHKLFWKSQSENHGTWSIALGGRKENFIFVVITEEESVVEHSAL